MDLRERAGPETSASPGLSYRTQFALHLLCLDTRAERRHDVGHEDFYRS